MENPNKKDDFIAAEPLEDAIVLNVGDLLQRWSNGYFPRIPAFNLGS